MHDGSLNADLPSAKGRDADLGDVGARKHDDWNVAGVLEQAWNQRKRG